MEASPFLLNFYCFQQSIFFLLIQIPFYPTKWHKKTASRRVFYPMLLYILRLPTLKSGIPPFCDDSQSWIKHLTSSSEGSLAFRYSPVRFTVRSSACSLMVRQESSHVTIASRSLTGQNSFRFFFQPFQLCSQAANLRIKVSNFFFLQLLLFSSVSLAL